MGLDAMIWVFFLMLTYKSAFSLSSFTLIKGFFSSSSLSAFTVQSLSRVQLFATPWIAACQASLSVTNSRSLLKLMSIKSVMPSSHLMFCRNLLLLPPIPPSIKVFSNESTLRMRWPKYFCLQSGIICISEVVDISPSNLDSSFWPTLTFHMIYSA